MAGRTQGRPAVPKWCGRGVGGVGGGILVPRSDLRSRIYGAEWAK